MSKRAEYSIVLVNQDSVARADFGRKNGQPLLGPVHEKIDAEASISQALEPVARIDQRFARTTIVLAPRLWTQKVSLPRLSVADLTAEELSSALRFEIETLCGIDADTATVSFQPLEQKGDEVFYWVTVIPSEDYAAILELLESRGARQVLVAHPAGIGCHVDRPQMGSGGQPSRRVEFWRDLACFLDNRTGHLEKLTPWNSDSQIWDQTLGISQDSDSIQYWIGPESADLPASVDANPSICRLSDDDFLTAWMLDVKQTIAGSSLPFPIIEKPKFNSWPRQRMLAKTLLALIAVIGCLLNWQWLNQRQTKLLTAAEALRKPSDEKQKYDSQIARIKKQSETLSAKAKQIEADSTKIQFLVQNQSDRLNRLLNYLQDLHTDDIQIREIISDEKGLSIVGVSLSSETAPLLATQLRQLTLPMGWKAHAATQIGEKKMVNGGPWTFTIVLEDVGPFETEITAAQDVDHLPNQLQLQKR